MTSFAQLFKLLVLILILAAWGVSAEAAPSAILTVGPDCTYSSLQAAVNAASDGDTIRLQATTLSGSDAIATINNKSLTIVGGYAINCSTPLRTQTILDGDGQGNTVLTLTGAFDNRTVTLSNTIVQGGNGGATAGGGINIGRRYDMTLTNVIVRDNIGANGAGVKLASTVLPLSDTVLQLERSSIIGNSASNQGGGIYCALGEVRIREGSTIGVPRGGNSASAGGGVYTDQCTLAIGDGATVKHNTAANGGGVYGTDGSVVFLVEESAEISDNASTQSGAGLYLNNGSTFFASRGHVDRNSAESDGGGIYAENDVQLLLTDTAACDAGRCLTLSGNAADNDGGGLYAHDSKVTLRRINIEDNYSGANGAAVYIETSPSYALTAPVLLAEATLIARNEALDRAIVKLVQPPLGGQDVEMKGVTFAYNHTTVPTNELLDIAASGDFDMQLTGLVVGGQQSEEQDGIGASVNTTMACSVLPFGWDFPAASNVIGSDPLFRNPASDDFRLAANSPAVDICAASTGSNDLLGRDRPVDLPAELGNQTISTGPYDAGAYEFSGLFGLNGAPCSMMTLADALADANPGDAIYGLPLTYNNVLGTVATSLGLSASSMAGCDVQPAGDDLLTLDAAGFNDRVALINNSATVTMTQVAAINGNSANPGGNIHVLEGSLRLLRSEVRNGTTATIGGGVHIAQGTLWVEDSRIVGNQAELGGGIAGQLSAQITILGDSTVGDGSVAGQNTATDSGGGVYLTRNTVLTMTNSATLHRNVAPDGAGGGIFVDRFQIAGNPTSVRLYDSASIWDNAASEGGGVHLDFAGQLEMYDSATVTLNSAENDGGGIYAKGSLSKVIMRDNSSLQFNEADEHGGGISVDSGSSIDIADNAGIHHNNARWGGGLSARQVDTTVTVSQAAIYSNTAQVGGGLEVDGGARVTLTNGAEVRHNVATDGPISTGGGIAMSGATTVVTATSGTQIMHNMSIQAGGGVHADFAATFVLMDSAEVSHNSSRVGGGIALYSNSTFTGTNAAIQQNTASNRGGGFYQFDSTLLDDARSTLTNVSIHHNDAGSGAGVYVNGGEATFIDSSLANNVATGDGGGLNMHGGVVTLTSAETSPTQRTACDSSMLAANRFCSELYGNEAAKGSAIYRSGGTLHITRTAIIANRGSGGPNGADNSIIGIRSSNEPMSLDTVLIANNINIPAVLDLQPALNGMPVSLQNSTITRNVGLQIFTNNFVDLTIERSIIWGNNQGTGIALGATFSSACNITQSEQALTQPFTGPNDSGSDPLLVSTARGDGYLDAASPAIDACSGNAGSDLSGQARPIDGDAVPSASELDMGAFEFDPSGIPTAVALQTEGAQAVGVAWEIWLLAAVVGSMTGMILLRKTALTA